MTAPNGVGESMYQQYRSLQWISLRFFVLGFVVVVAAAAASATPSVTAFQPSQPRRAAFYQHGSRLQVVSEPTKIMFDDAVPLFVEPSDTQKSVQEYYGKKLQSSADLQTNACCTGSAPPIYIRDCLNKVHPTVKAKYYGCGLCLPDYDLTGTTVLDLGCGAGRDVYIAAQLVGESGKVFGLDMTEEQLAVAREYEDYHAEQFGYKQKNTEFVTGYLESLHEMMGKNLLQRSSFDLIISNCVINLVQDKQAVLKSCYELLKPGGEMYFSDVYASRRVPETLQKDQLLWGECLSGALYWNDFVNTAKRVGFADPRLVEDSPITIQNKDVQQMITDKGHGGLQFYSATYRLFKSDNLEAACEDYGQAVIYKGTIPRAASEWKLDGGHVFEQGKVHPVCGNTWNMLAENPRLQPHFEFIGNFNTHYGIFEGCGSSMPFSRAGTKGEKSGGGGCC